MKARKADNTEFYGVGVWFFFVSRGNCFLKSVRARACAV